MLKHFGRQILCLMSVPHSANDKRVDTLKIRFVQVGKAAWVFLRGLNLQPFLLHRLYKRRGGVKSHARFVDLEKSRTILHE